MISSDVLVDFSILLRFVWVGIGFFGGREADNFFNILIVMAFLIFSAEIVAASLGVRGYFHSFFFYLDPGEWPVAQLDTQEIQVLKIKL